MNNIIKYYHEYSYPSAANLYTIMKQAGETVTRSQVKDAIDGELVN